MKQSPKSNELKSAGTGGPTAGKSNEDDKAPTGVMAPEVARKMAIFTDAGASPEEAQQLALAAPATKAEKAHATGHLKNIEHSLAIDPRTARQLSDKIGTEDAGLALALQHIALNPGDEIERMLMNQMLAMNGLALRSTLRAHNSEYVQQTESFIAQANKCSRTFAVLVDTLSRHRGKTSEQKVTVEHVHVHEGGQAIVGNVAAPAGVGRRKKKGQSTP